MCKLVCGLPQREWSIFVHDPGDESNPGVTGDVLATQLENVTGLHGLLKDVFEKVIKDEKGKEIPTPWPSDEILVLDLFVPDPPIYLRPAKYDYIYLLPCAQGRAEIVKSTTPPVIGGTAAGAKA